ncbi:hypothetical protein VNPA141581_19150 [Pseudomonas aeruginosa]|nr:hypothetical protein VNPA141581_19150 [Pseudomonas aeruginosa]
MDNLNSAVQVLIHGSNTLFILLGAVMVLAMHAGFAFLEVGTVRLKNQVNALSKILSDFAISALAYFFVGYWIAYGVTFFHPAAALTVDSGYALVKFFFLLTFAAAIPAIISGGIAERARFGPQLCATALIVAFVYPFFEGLVWNGNFGLQEWLKLEFGAPFHDFAGSVVVHALGGWLALAAVLLLGSRNGRYRDGKLVAMAPSSIPFLALGSWILIIGWFGFNVMSAQTLAGVSGLVAVNSLLAMVGGTMASLLIGRNDPGFLHNGPLAGFVGVWGGLGGGFFGPPVLGGARRGEPGQPGARQPAGGDGGFRRRPVGLWADEGAAGHPLEPGGGVLRRGPVDPQDRRDQPRMRGRTSLVRWGIGG